MAWTRTLQDTSPQNWDNTAGSRNPEMNRLRFLLFGATRDTTNREPLIHVPFQFKPSSTSNAGWAVQINQDNATSIGLDIDHEGTTADAVNISVAALTTGIAIDVPDADLLTTGKIFNGVSNAPGTGTRTLFQFTNDNTLATGTTVANFQQDAAQAAVTITHTAATGTALTVTASQTTANVQSIVANSITTGSLLSATSTSTDTGVRMMASIENNSLAATGAVPLNLTQTSTKEVLRFTLTGTAATNTQVAWAFTGYTGVSQFPCFASSYGTTVLGAIRFQAAASTCAIPFYIAI